MLFSLAAILFYPRLATRIKKAKGFQSAALRGHRSAKNSCICFSDAILRIFVLEVLAPLFQTNISALSDK